jgi:hypothetical protein
MDYPEVAPDGGQIEVDVAYDGAGMRDVSSAETPQKHGASASGRDLAGVWRAARGVDAGKRDRGCLGGAGGGAGAAHHGGAGWVPRTLFGALANRWDQLIDVYWAALPGLATDDATLGKAREQLLAVGRELRERPDLAAVLRERGEAFGMAKRPNFQRVVADAQPERVIARILKRSEHEMRVEQAQQAEREQEQQRHAYRERWPVARDVR